MIYKKVNFKIILVSLLIGISSGLFSAGGGLIATIAFEHILNFSDKESRAMAICSILPMVLTSLCFYNREGYIEWKTGILCGIGGVIGGAIGSILLQRVNGKYLKLILIIFLFYSSITILCG